MAPAGAGKVSFTIASPRATLFEAITQSLSPEQGILMTHLVVWLLTLVSGVFLVLRFLAIWYKKFVLVVDDGLLAASWIIVLFFSITVSLSLALGTGIASSESNASTLPSAPLLLDNVTRTAALTAAAWSKAAFACGLLGLSSRQLVRWALLSLAVIVNLVAVGGIVVQWIRCRPLHKAWVVGAEGSCLERETSNAVGIGVQAVFGSVDILLVALGYMLVWSKDLFLSEKIGVGVLGMLGLLASAGAIVTAVEISTLTDANFVETNVRPLLASSLEAPLIIIAASLPAIRLLLSSTASSHPLRTRIRILDHHESRRPSSTLTPLEPSMPLGLRPPRPLRPMSSRSFMTTSTKGGDKLGLAGNSSDNLIKGLDYNYNFNYWNPAIPPTTTTTTTLNATSGGGTAQQPQQPQQQGHTPALSTSSTLYSTPPAPQLPLSNLATPDTPEAFPSSSSPQHPARSPGSVRGNHLAHPANPTGNNSNSSNTKARGTNHSTNTGPSHSPYHWHSTNVTNVYPSKPTSRRLTPLKEEARANDNRSWASDRSSDVALFRNNSTRRESPTLGTWTNTNRPKAGVFQEHDDRERDSVDRENEFEYDTPRGRTSYFSRLQSFSGYVVGNPFTNRI